MSKAKKWLFFIEIFTRMFWAIREVFKSKVNEEKTTKEEEKDNNPAEDNVEN